MKLNLEGLRAREAWQAAGVALPSYPVAQTAERTRTQPVWLHFGIGNIFRIFIGGVADTLLNAGEADRGIICAETFDDEIVDRVYLPHDNLALAVTLHGDGSTQRRIIGSLAEAVKANAPAGRERLKTIFANPGLQLVSFTITEKGYALRDASGAFTAAAQADLQRGPDGAETAMGIVAAMLAHRHACGAAPLALVSMDNVSQNGRKLREAVLTILKAWADAGLIDPACADWAADESRVAFPWTMIDKITPRPAQAVADALAADGIEDMGIVVTAKHTYIAPFVNAEAPQYLVIEDSFPNGRPPLEAAGVAMTDRRTVMLSERMKVTACLNPLHTALCTYACMLGYELFADAMHDPELAALAHRIGYDEGLPVVADPGILSPKAFLDEVIRVRFPNPYLGDTSQRIAVDISQMVGIRFGETIKAYVARDGSAAGLTGIALAIAGWLRYLLAVDDAGQPFSLAPDPMIPELQAQLAGLRVGNPDSLKDQLKPLLANAHLFGSDLWQAGLGSLIETMLRQELAGPGAVRATLQHYLK